MLLIFVEFHTKPLTTLSNFFAMINTLWNPQAKVVTGCSHSNHIQIFLQNNQDKLSPYVPNPRHPLPHLPAFGRHRSRLRVRAHRPHPHPLRMGTRRHRRTGHPQQERMKQHYDEYDLRIFVVTFENFLIVI